MSVKIRLARQGSKKRPQFMIVAVDSERTRDGAFLQKLGYYFPKVTDVKKKIQIDMEAFNKWKGLGAQVSQTVGQLVRSVAK